MLGCERWSRGGRRHDEIGLLTVQGQIRDLSCLVIVRALANFLPRVHLHFELCSDWLDPRAEVLVVGGEEKVWLTLLNAQVHDDATVGVDRVLSESKARIVDGLLLCLVVQDAVWYFLPCESVFADVQIPVLLAILALELENLEAVLLCANGW